MSHFSSLFSFFFAFCPSAKGHIQSNFLAGNSQVKGPKKALKRELRAACCE